MDLGLESGRLTKEVYVKNFLLNFQSQSSMVSLCKFFLTVLYLQLDIFLLVAWQKH